MTKNKDLNNASKAKKDEFWTRLNTIEDEMVHYKHHFKDKVVFCNCDDPEWSNFWKYFELNFNVLGLKKLVATHYEKDKPSYMLEISRDLNMDGIFDNRDIKTTPLKENGDFRSPECIEILKTSDIIATNPPFSIANQHLDQLIKYNKKFIIIGNQNSITRKDVFPLIKNNEMWYGASIHSGGREFMVPDDYPLNAAGFRVDNEGRKYIRVKGVRWYTNLDYKKRHEDLILYKKYTPEAYPTYLNFDAINVEKTKDIPCDYDGLIGVPITFIDKYNPAQFEIIGNSSELAGPVVINGVTKKNPGRFYLLENGAPKRLYDRIVIRRRPSKEGNNA